MTIHYERARRGGGGGRRGLKVHLASGPNYELWYNSPLHTIPPSQQQTLLSTPSHHHNNKLSLILTKNLTDKFEMFVGGSWPDEGWVAPYIVNKFYCFQLSSDPFQSNDSMVCALIDELPVSGTNEPFVKCLSPKQMFLWGSGAISRTCYYTYFPVQNEIEIPRLDSPGPPDGIK